MTIDDLLLYDVIHSVSSHYRQGSPVQPYETLTSILRLMTPVNTLSGVNQTWI